MSESISDFKKSAQMIAEASRQLNVLANEPAPERESWWAMLSLTHEELNAAIQEHRRVVNEMMPK